MDDVASARSENANLRKLQQKLLQWDAQSDALAPLTAGQLEALEALGALDMAPIESVAESDRIEAAASDSTTDIPPQSRSFAQLSANHAAGIESARVFLAWYQQLDAEMYDRLDDVHTDYHSQLLARSDECDALLGQIDGALGSLSGLQSEYTFVSDRTQSLNQASEQLIDEQQRLNAIGEEIKRRLEYFTQSELLLQRLHSPTMSVASEIFVETLNRIDECLAYLQANPKYKEAATYTVKYRMCLCKAMQLMKTYVTNAFQTATQQVIDSKQASQQAATGSGGADDNTANTAFAIYYGKFQSCSPKVKRITALIEERLERSAEYEVLLTDLHQAFLTHRANIMCGEVDIAVRNLTTTCRGDHCTLVRSACAFMVHVCQDEHRLFYNFFSNTSDQLGAYLDGLCTILYDTLRPFIIHINHLETLAEICQILRVEMLDEYVHNNPDPLEPFGKTANQLLQDVQERLVFRANLYLTSDILNYRPSAGDLAYPEKLVMMENIAMSLQEPTPVFRRSDSQGSIGSSVSQALDVDQQQQQQAQRTRSGNSTADMHGMWYPTVRRTLVCLSRLYRCVDRPIFQGLSQEALAYCIQSVSAAAAQIATRKTRIDAELFEIKHLLILREQIAPFRVDFTVKETTLDFSKVKTAAFGLLQRRKQLFAMGSNNAILEFLLDGAPTVREHLHDSRKDVDRQLKSVCEQFIRDATGQLIAPLVAFLERAQQFAKAAAAAAAGDGSEPQLRQQPWASPQHVSEVCQTAQRLVKQQLTGVQRSMQLYLSNRDTEFILFRPIRNSIIGSFVRLEQLLATSAYNADDLVIAGCPTADQISVLLSASVLTDAGAAAAAPMRRVSTGSAEGGDTGGSVAVAARKVSMEKKVSFDTPPIREDSESRAALLEEAGEVTVPVPEEREPLMKAEASETKG